MPYCSDGSYSRYGCDGLSSAARFGIGELWAIRRCQRREDWAKREAGSFILAFLWRVPFLSLFPSFPLSLSYFSSFVLTHLTNNVVLGTLLSHGSSSPLLLLPVRGLSAKPGAGIAVVVIVLLVFATSLARKSRMRRFEANSANYIANQQAGYPTSNNPYTSPLGYAQPSADSGYPTGASPYGAGGAYGGQQAVYYPPPPANPTDVRGTDGGDGNFYAPPPGPPPPAYQPPADNK
ncbi:hypothetical protein IE53DRAFT_109358 [Violaceomyces palustris]|uniref:Uncharacterized protein n=1 Tax=Violaceomyces palustris TaxID=1673888 RepID=A0ACD0NWJ3_9BASI|nr:hypothetical protein IE53DRAFT_109358 [Violaceomyces palustris]